MLGMYILNADRNPVPCDDPEVWSYSFSLDRHVARTEVAPGIVVSTVFLGLDHNYTDEGPPLVFETMIFGGPRSGYCERYATWIDAELGHAYAVSIATEQPSEESVTRNNREDGERMKTNRNANTSRNDQMPTGLSLIGWIVLGALLAGTFAAIEIAIVRYIWGKF